MVNIAALTTVLKALRLLPAPVKPEPNVGWLDVPILNSLIEASNFASIPPADGSCNVPLYDVVPVPPSIDPPFNQDRADIYRYRQQRSVNLGSWFVLENWMAPSLFTCAAGNKGGEHDVAAGWGNTINSRQLLERHWDSWITEDDFVSLSAMGINTVRLPIGYWNLGPAFCFGTDFEDVGDAYVNSWARVRRAINMAGKHGLGVLVDLHGAPGSQNGQSHSGISTGRANLFSDLTNINRTMEVLQFLTDELSMINNVVGIQLLNEPINRPELPKFYNDTLRMLRSTSPQAQKFPYYIHDAFNLEQYADFITQREDFVVQDHHSYFVYTSSDIEKPASDHTNDIENSLADALAAASHKTRHNIVIDEWSCALTDESLKNEPDPVAARRDFCEGQMEVYANQTAGWGFWSYYKEGCKHDNGWCFKSAVGTALPSTFWSYKGVDSEQAVHSNPLTKGYVGVTAPSRVNDAMAGLGISTVPSMSSSQRRRRSFRSTQFHRHKAIHVHRHRRENGDSDDDSDENKNWTPPASSFSSMDDDLKKLTDTLGLPEHKPAASDAAITKGYADGRTTAEVFAAHGYSRLGFKEQYVRDRIKGLQGMKDGLSMDPKVVQAYRTWFLRGVADREVEIQASLLGTEPDYSVSSE